MNGAETIQDPPDQDPPCQDLETGLVEDPKNADCIERLQEMMKQAHPLMLQYQASPTPEHLEYILTAFDAFDFSVEDFERLQRIGPLIGQEIIAINVRLDFAESQLKRAIQPNGVTEREELDAVCGQTLQDLGEIVETLEVPIIERTELLESTEPTEQPASAPIKHVRKAMDELNKVKERLEAQQASLEKLDQFGIIMAGLHVRIRKLLRNFQEDKRAYVLQRDQDTIIGCMTVFLNATENDATAAFFRLKPADRDSLIELHKKAVGLRSEFSEWEAQVGKAYDQFMVQRKACKAHGAEGHVLLPFAESVHCLARYFTQKDLDIAATAKTKSPFADKTQTALKDVLAVRADEKFNRSIADLQQQIHAIEEKLGINQTDSVPVDENSALKSKKIDALQLRATLIETCVLLGECGFFDEMLADQAESFIRIPAYRFLYKGTKLADVEVMSQGFKAFLGMGSVLEMIAAVSTDGRHSELYPQLQAVQGAFLRTIDIAQKEVIAYYELCREKYFGTQAFLFNAKEKAYEKLKAAYDEAKPFQIYRTFIPVRSGDVHDVNEVGIADEIDNLDPKSLEDILKDVESEILIFKAKPVKEKVKDNKIMYTLQCLEYAKKRLLERIEASTKEAYAVIKAVNPFLDEMDKVCEKSDNTYSNVSKFIDVWIRFVNEKDLFTKMTEWRKLDQRQFRELFPRIGKAEYLTISRFQEKWGQLHTFATQTILRLWHIIREYPISKLSILLMDDKDDASPLATSMTRLFDNHPRLCKMLLGQDYNPFRATFEKAILLPQAAFQWALDFDRAFYQVLAAYENLKGNGQEARKRFYDEYCELRALFSPEDIKRAQNIKTNAQCPNPLCLNTLLAVTNPEKIFPEITDIVQEFGVAKN